MSQHSGGVTVRSRTPPMTLRVLLSTNFPLHGIFIGIYGDVILYRGVVFSTGTVTRVVIAPDKLCPRRVLHVPDETVTPD